MSAAAHGAPSAVSPDEAQAWVRYLVPLPKSVEITGKVALEVSDVAVVPPPGADKIVDQAVKELKQAIGQSDALSAGPFKIEMILAGPDADRLKTLKNSDQAYSIAPTESNTGLRLVAMTSRGLYYAAKTLQQLVRPRAKSGNVEIPMLTVTDWPDLQDRGLWGGDSGTNIEWLAERKMNVIENISTRSVDRKGRG